MECTACREVLSAALDHEADAAELALASSHVAECDACRAYRSRLEALHRRVRLRPGEPVPDRTAAILAAVAQPERAGFTRSGVIVAAVAVVALAVSAFVVASRSDDEVRLVASPSVSVSEVAVRQGPPGGLSMVSFKVRNLSTRPDALVGARTAVADMATLHALRTVDGREIMQSVDQIALAAGETRDLGDGTSHIMLVDLRQQLEPGVRVTIELDFVHAPPVDVDGLVVA
ncbi:MAG TPA: copper chaperone PCu(A)C [Acidimicrobiales bacterium]|nr:copper chaperone PCu(A)C [Acidimicrobiales bacterium]